MGLPAEEPGTNGRGNDVSKATYSKVTKNSSTPSKPDVALPLGEARQQQSTGGVAPVEPPKALSDGTEQKTVKAAPKESPNQPPPQQQSTREGGARQAQVLCMSGCVSACLCVWGVLGGVAVCGGWGWVGRYIYVCVCLCNTNMHYREISAYHGKWEH